MLFDQLKWREFITFIGGAVAWPLAARAQQPAMPVVGMLNPQSAGSVPHFVDAFRGGLAETGYVEGQNVAIEYRRAEDRFDRLREFAEDLVRRKVNVIAAPANNPALAAKAATSTIPIVFGVGEDAVKLGLVASFAHPGGNATGISFFTVEVVAKRLGLLRELVPAAVRVAVLVNPTNVSNMSALTAVESRRSRPRHANPNLQRQHQSRDRHGHRGARARSNRRPLRRPGPVLPEPARPVGRAGRAPCASCGLFGASICRGRRVNELRH